MKPMLLPSTKRDFIETYMTRTAEQEPVVNAIAAVIGDDLVLKPVREIPIVSFEWCGMRAAIIMVNSYNDSVSVR